MSGPSDKAVQAGSANGRACSANMAQNVLRRAHNPALGLDRSVCLRDVVEALRKTSWGVADFIEREFGGTHA